MNLIPKVSKNESFDGTVTESIFYLSNTTLKMKKKW